MQNLQNEDHFVQGTLNTALKKIKVFLYNLEFAIIKFNCFNNIFIVLILFSWEISPDLSSGTTVIRFTGYLSPHTLLLTVRESVR